MTKKILIFGSSGLIGNNLAKYLILKKQKVILAERSKKTKRSNYLKFLIHNDLTNKKNWSNLEMQIIKLKPDIIINATGITKHHSNKKKMNIINILFPKFLLKVSSENKLKLIHLSTDCIFDGKKGNYKENSKSSAKDKYGITKAICESNLRNNKNCLILRTSIVGHEIKSKNGILEWFLSTKQKVYGYQNAFFTGPTALELSKIIYKIIKIKPKLSGIYNVGGKNISKYDLLILINEIYEINKKIYKNIDFEINRSLNTKKIREEIKYKLKNWKTLLLEQKKFHDKNF